MRYKALRLLNYTLVLTLTSVMAVAQTTSKSPYSRFGTGLSTYSGFAQHSALGRSSIALRSNQSFTQLNPASYTAIKYTTFDMGAFIEQGSMKADGGASRAVSNASIRYMGIAFPLSTKVGWGGSFGLVPFSNVGYNLTDNLTDTSFGQYDKYSDIRNGNGGLSRMYFGSGIDISKKLSFGINGYYNFGQLYRSSAIVHEDDSPLYNYVEDRTTSLHGLSYIAGMQYSFGSKGDSTQTGLKHVLGLTYGSGYNLNASTTTIGRTYELINNINSQQFSLRDTIQFSRDVEGKVKLPGSLAFGYSISRPDKWLLIGEFKQSSWSNYRFYGESDGLVNSQEFSIGGKKFGFKSNDQDMTRLKKLAVNTHYSAGLRFTNTNLTLAGENISEFGINFGASIPIGRKKIFTEDGSEYLVSRLNISGEYYTRGAGLETKGLISENYFRLTLGITLNDKWFDKPKFY